MVENVSRMVDRVHVHVGEAVVREGEYGDRFYNVAEGRLGVSCERGAYPSVGTGARRVASERLARVPIG